MSSSHLISSVRFQLRYEEQKSEKRTLTQGANFVRALFQRYTTAETAPKEEKGEIEEKSSLQIVRTLLTKQQASALIEEAKSICDKIEESKEKCRYYAQTRVPEALTALEVSKEVKKSTAPASELPPQDKLEKPKKLEGSLTPEEQLALSEFLAAIIEEQAYREIKEEQKEILKTAEEFDYIALTKLLEKNNGKSIKSEIWNNIIGYVLKRFEETHAEITHPVEKRAHSISFQKTLLVLLEHAFIDYIRYEKIKEYDDNVLMFVKQLLEKKSAEIDKYKMKVFSQIFNVYREYNIVPIYLSDGWSPKQQNWALKWNGYSHPHVELLSYVANDHIDDAIDEHKKTYDNHFKIFYQCLQKQEHNKECKKNKSVVDTQEQAYYTETNQIPVQADYTIADSILLPIMAKIINKSLPILNWSSPKMGALLSNNDKRIHEIYLALMKDSKDAKILHEWNSELKALKTFRESLRYYFNSTETITCLNEDTFRKEKQELTEKYKGMYFWVRSKQNPQDGNLYFVDPDDGLLKEVRFISEQAKNLFKQQACIPRKSTTLKYQTKSIEKNLFF